MKLHSASHLPRGGMAVISKPYRMTLGSSFSPFRESALIREGTDEPVSCPRGGRRDEQDRILVHWAKHLVGLDLLSDDVLDWLRSNA